MSYEANKIRLVMELRKQGITDKRVLGAVERVPRELFVPEALRSEAYENIPLPISQGQTISQPFIVAFMTQALIQRADYNTESARMLDDFNEAFHRDRELYSN